MIYFIVWHYFTNSGISCVKDSTNSLTIVQKSIFENLCWTVYNSTWANLLNPTQRSRKSADDTIIDGLKWMTSTVEMDEGGGQRVTVRVSWIASGDSSPQSCLLVSVLSCESFPSSCQHATRTEDVSYVQVLTPRTGFCIAH